MPRPILVNPEGGPVHVTGEFLEPGPARLKVDVWRHVRHPPPELIHAYSVRGLDDADPGPQSAGEPATLLGKVVTWVWICDRPDPDAVAWRVRVDVRQDDVSLPGYPAEYTGPLPPGQRLAHVRISEEVEANG